MFGFFPNGVGVANVRDFADAMPHLPRWITAARSGAGFVELAQRPDRGADREGRDGDTFTHTFLYELVTLFVILDPVATIPIFLAATVGLTRKESLKVGRLCRFASPSCVLLFFIAGGQFLLEALHIPMPSFQLAGSIVLLLFG